MSSECVCEVLAQNTRQIIFYSLLNLPLLSYEPKRSVFEYVALNARELLLPEKRAELQELKLALAVLAFANKHSTISTSLLSLQKTYSVSKSVIWLYCA